MGIDDMMNKVLCPGKDKHDYCDCEGDCNGNPSFCQCDDAKKCCKDAEPVVLCEGKDEDDFCDCNGDCEKNPSFCGCAEAIKCCSEKKDKKKGGGNKAMVENKDLRTAEMKDEFKKKKDNFMKKKDKELKVLCPEKDKADYCDCDGDCDENPSFCECDEAKKCCSKKMLRTVVAPL